MNTLKAILLHSSGEKFFIAGDELRTKYGIIYSRQLNKGFGNVIESDKGEKFLALEPSTQDLIENFRMGSRPIYPYDSGLICSLLDIHSGKKVLEAGTGSGGLTAFMATLGADVTSYELEPEFHEKAKINLKDFKVTLKQGDVTKAKEKGFDAIFLDVREGAQVINKVQDKLNVGGWLGYYSPVIEEIKPAYDVMREQFFDVRAIITDVRQLRVKKFVGLGPSMGYPGFFIYGRKRGAFRVKTKEDILLEAKGSGSSNGA